MTLRNNLLSLALSSLTLAIPLLIPRPLTVAGDGILWTAVVLLAGFILRVFAKERARYYLPLVLLGWLIFGVGLSRFISVIFWLFSVWCLGLCFLSAAYKCSDPFRVSGVEAVLAGVVIWLGISGVLIHFPVNYRVLYMVLCASPCLIIAYRLPVQLEHHRMRLFDQWSDLSAVPYLGWTVGLAFISWALRWSALPSVGYDDHALHLRMWTELRTLRTYTFDVESQIWSIAPFSVDLLHSGISLIADDDVRSAFNLVLALAVLHLMLKIWRLICIPIRTQWLLLVLMATTPMFGGLLLQLQTELFLSVLGLSGVYLLLKADGGWRGPNVLGLMLCAGLCAATKLPGVLLGILLLATLSIRLSGQQAGRASGGPRLTGNALLLFIPLCFVAFHSYVTAWLVAGNPVLPLYNSFFKSPFFPDANFVDERWIRGFGFSSYFDAFFNTSQYVEAGNYTAGWQYLLLFPLAVLWLFRPGLPKSLRIMLIPVLGFGLVMFSATQYWRYLFPVMPLAGVVLAALFLGGNPKLRMILVVVTGACVCLNIIFFNRISWLMGSPALQAFTERGRAEILRFYAPAVLLNDFIGKQASGSRVLYPKSVPYGATLGGQPLYINWYSSSRQMRFDSARSAPEMGQFLALEKVDFVITDLSEVHPQKSSGSALREYLAQHGSVLAREGNLLLYRFYEAPVLYRTAFDLNAISRQENHLVESFVSPVNRQLEVSFVPKLVARISILGGRQARYRVQFRCGSQDGKFVAQINWDKGFPYHRHVNCESTDASFSEAIPIPDGVTFGDVYVSMLGPATGIVQELVVEIQ